MAEKTYRIPTVLTAEELLDKAFHRASKISIKGTNFLDGKKKTVLAKVTASGDIITDALGGYVEKFPRIEKDEDFLPELVDIIIGLDQYKKSLGAVNWACNVTNAAGRIGFQSEGGQIWFRNARIRPMDEK